MIGRWHGLAALVALLASAAAHAERPTVAVFDFEIGTTQSTEVTVTDGSGTSSSEVEQSAQTSLLTNKIITELTQSGAVSVVERKKVGQIMEEAQLTQQDLAEASTAAELGKLLGAEYMIFGSVDALRPSVSIEDLAYDAGEQKVMSLTASATARLVETETGEIVAAEDLQVSRSSEQLNPADTSRSIPAGFYRSVLNDLAGKLSSRLVTVISPIQVAKQEGDTVYLARSRLDTGERLEIVELGEEIVDPDSGEVLGKTEHPVAVVEVTEGLANMSKAQIVEWQAEEQRIPAGSIARPTD